MPGQKTFYWLTVGLLIAVAGLTAVPVLADDGLPERETPVADDGGRDDSRPLGTHIELVVPEHAGAWSVVQWQDSAGNWHDAEGWRGTLDSSGYICWWVAAKDFGTGPFRWVITGGDSVSVADEWSTGGSSGLFQSETSSGAFSLPGGATAPLQVSLP
jgi:hypothetical protein